jgi:hypothetical protein
VLEKATSFHRFFHHTGLYQLHGHYLETEISVYSLPVISSDSCVCRPAAAPLAHLVEFLHPIFVRTEIKIAREHKNHLDSVVYFSLILARM